MKKFLSEVARGTNDYFKTIHGKIMLGFCLMAIFITVLAVFLNQP